MSSQVRAAELSVFAEGAAIPSRLVALLWRATAQLTPRQSRSMCRRLARDGTIRLRRQVATIDPATRSRLRETLGAQLPATQAALLDELRAALLPGAGWWNLPATESYLWDHLAGHVTEAGRADEFDTTIANLRWVTTRLARSGVAAADADLITGGTDRARMLSWNITRIQHLLEPTTPAHGVVDILLSRLHDDLAWRDEVEQVWRECITPGLTSSWPLPDVPETWLGARLVGHSGWVTAVAVAPDSTWLISGGGHDGVIRMWDSVTCVLRQKFEPEQGGIDALAIAPDGTWFASAHGATVAIWDVAGSASRLRIDPPLPSFEGIGRLAVSPDSTRLAVVTSRGELTMWDGRTGSEIAVAGEAHGVRAIVATTDSRWLALARWGDRSVRIWDLDSGAQLHHIEVKHREEVHAIAMSADGALVATAGGRYDPWLKVWYTATGRLKCAMKTEHDGIESVTFLGDGRTIATTGGQMDDAVALWDATMGQPCGSPLRGDAFGVLALAASRSGNWVATGDQDNSVRVWTLTAYTVERDWGTGVRGPVAVSPDGTRIVGSSGRHSRLHICDRATGEVRSTATEVDAARLAMAHDGSWVAACDWGGTTVWLVDMATGDILRTLTPDHGVRRLRSFPNLSRVAVGDEEGKVTVWDASTGRVITRIDAGGDGVRVELLEVSPDGTWLATVAHLDHAVRLWDAASGQLRHILASPEPIERVAAPRDSTWLATAEWGGVIRVWDTHTGRQRRVINLVGSARRSRRGMFETPDRVKELAADPDGTWLATAVEDHPDLRVWRVATGARLAALAVGPVRSCAVSPGGAWLAVVAGSSVASSITTVTVWRTSTWECMATTRVNGRVDSCTWTLDSGAVVLEGARGVYLFEFRAGPNEKRSRSRSPWTRRRASTTASVLVST